MDVIAHGLIFQPTELYGALRRFPDEVEDRSEVFWDAWKATGVPCLKIEPPGGTPPRCAVLYLHGNAGTIGASRAFAHHIADAAGARVFVVEYPGYWLDAAGKLPEPASAAALYKAATESARFVLSVIGNLPLCVIGFSLGCSPAARVAKTLGAGARGLVLVAPMTSLAGIAADKFPSLRSVPWLTSMVDAFKTEEDAKGCYQTHALVIHSQSDEVIGFAHGVRRAPAAPAVAHLNSGARARKRPPRPVFLYKTSPRGCAGYPRRSRMARSSSSPRRR